MIPGAETVGTVANYDPFRRLADVEFRIYEGLPHNICDAVPDRCATDFRDFLRLRFANSIVGWAEQREAHGRRLR